MSDTSLASLGTSLAVVVLGTLAPAMARADEEGDRLAAVLERHAPSVVTVKIVLKTEMHMMGQGQDQESRMELQGTVVDASGLVMLSSTPFSSDRMEEMMGGMGGAPEGEFGIKMTPKEIKVIFEREETEYDAFLAATDSKLDLAFVQVERLEGKELRPVGFEEARDLAVGQKVASVSRLAKGYDFAPYFETARVSGEIAKPRKAWMLDGGLGAFGLPVYDLDGATVGVLTTVSSGIKDDGEDSGGFGAFMRLMTGGGLSGNMGAFIIPSKNVKGVVEQARVRAGEVAAERAKEKEAPKEPEKPEAPKEPEKPATPPGGGAGGMGKDF
ncbi:MAG: trypsin-like peptidase domain-containing protein [Planctomycetes bacterium]|nr:trypsin-like peptidase domain-containing protein [Planctomycetota bacterium]